jgi:hypothetical protein
MAQLYKLAIDEPSLKVNEILQMNNVKPHIYSNLIKYHMSISKYRKIMLGSSKILQNLNKSSKRSMTDNRQKIH